MGSPTAGSGTIPALGLTVTGLAAYSVALDRLIPRRWHLATNLAAGGALLATARVGGMSARELGTARSPLRAAARLGLGISTAAATAIALVATPRRTRRHFADERVRAGSRREMAYETLARIPIGTALFEEVAFRGVLSGLLLRTVAPGSAYLVSATAFGLWHVLPTLRDHAGSPTASRVSPRTAALSTVVVTMPAGLAFEALRRRSDSLLTPILAHAALNASAYLAAQAAHGEMDRAAAGAGGLTNR